MNEWTNEFDIKNYIRSTNLLDYGVIQYITNIKKAYQAYKLFMDKYYNKIVSEVNSINRVLEYSYDNQNIVKRTKVK